MKKPSKERDRFFARNALRELARAMSRRDKARSTAPKRRYVRLVAPSILSFRRNFDETMEFLDALRTATSGPDADHIHASVDLVPITDISVPVAIVLAAEFHRWSLIRKRRLRPINVAKWSPAVRNLLSDLGVFKLLGIGPIAKSLGTASNITLTKLSSGLRFDGQTIDRIQTAWTGILEGFTSRPELYAGLAEAAENAIAHAYPPQFNSPFRLAGYRWWSASCLDPISMRLRFFVFDQGAGIPFTLPTVSWYEDIRSAVARLGLPNDAMMLKAAFEVGRTRTGQANRGLGLARMAGVVAASNSAYLRVLSGQGELVCTGDGKIDAKGLSRSVGGTLIEWNMPADVFIDDLEADAA